MTVLRKTLVRLLWVAGVLLASAFAASGPSQTIHKRVAVVFLMHQAPFCSGAVECALPAVVGLQGSVLTPRRSAASYESGLNYQMTRYFDENSFNRSHLTFEAILNPERSDGWFEAPHRLYYYNQPGTETEFTGNRVFFDALDLAYPLVGDALLEYDMLLVVQNIQALYGYALGCGDPDPGGYTTCGIGTGPLQLNLAMATIGENVDDESLYEVAGHELGHLHGLSHVRMGPYDLIGDSDVQTHFSSWSKLDAGWSAGIADTLCLDGPCEVTTDLTPLERAGNNVLLIPFVNNPLREFIGYMVECRAKVGFDMKIPEAGVIISRVDVPADPGLPAALVYPSATTDDANAALSPGELFVDADREITVEYLSKDGVDNCRVQATRGDVAAPDPWIRSDGSAQANSGGLNHWSRDIWIDSQENGWDTYPFGESYTSEGGQVAPTGYGDPFWVGHENRIMFKIRNQGFGPAEDIRVRVYVRQPLTVHIPSLECPRTRQGPDQLVGSVMIDHLEEGGIYFGSVPWTPSAESAALVTVIIEDYPGELTHSNNRARETYGSQGTLQVIASGSGMQAAVHSLFAVPTLAVASEENCEYRLPIWINRFVIGETFRRDWVMDLSTIQGMALPDETTEVPLTGLPPANAQPGECSEVGVLVRAFLDDKIEPIEAFSFRSCVVAMTDLTCQTGQDPVALGTDVLVTGALTPAATRATIALEFTRPDGKTTIENVALNGLGHYRHVTVPDQAGQWTLQASWQGDSATAPARSGLCTFTVAKATPILTLDRNANCRSGPGMGYPVVTSDVKGAMIEIEARSPDSEWLFGKVLGARCWLYAGVGALNVALESLPVRQPPASPTPTASLCQTYTSQSVCQRHSEVCVWMATSGTCRAR